MHGVNFIGLRSLVAASLSVGGSVLAQSADLNPSVAHGGVVAREHTAGDCISPAQRAEALSAVSAYMLASGHGETSRSLPQVPFIPIGGTLFADILPPGYVDQDPTSPGFHDYSCHAFTYDGHAGDDFGLHSFAEQDVGVPVFAVLDGTVVYSHDGEPDKSTCMCGALANALIIDHGGGLFGWYWHFRNGTNTLHEGDHVVAGQQLALAGSSGNSAGPHLHLGFADSEGGVYDPFEGDCGGLGLWVTQPDLNLDTYIADFGFSTQNLSEFQYYPYAFPNTGQMGFDEYLWFWAQVVNLPPHSTWRQKYVQPDGTLAFDSGDVSFEDNQTDFYRVSNWWWYSYYVWQMRTYAGTWHIQLYINDALTINAPLEVKTQSDPNFNRPPVAVSASFDPPVPMAGSPLFVRVDAPLALDDPDYDRVRYHYVWQVNGETIRDVTYAGRADAIDRTKLNPGDIVSCTVTPNDGKVNGPSSNATASTAICPADFNADGFVDFFDFNDFVTCFEGGNCPAGQTADFNHDGFPDFFDFNDFIDAFETGC